MHLISHSPLSHRSISLYKRHIPSHSAITASPRTNRSYSTMAPIIHCVRHAQVKFQSSDFPLSIRDTNQPDFQGFHNLNTANHVLPDPLLTPLGEEQCINLRANFSYHKSVDMVVASPLRRTIYTALLGFETEIKSKGLKIIALPEIQETSDVPCDTGSDLEALKKEVQEKQLPVDLDLVDGNWNSKVRYNRSNLLLAGGSLVKNLWVDMKLTCCIFIQEGKWAPTASAIVNRAREARRWLKSRPEKEIVLVTHGGFLHFFTEDWQDSSLYQGTFYVVSHLVGKTGNHWSYRVNERANATFIRYLVSNNRPDHTANYPSRLLKHQLTVPLFLKSRCRTPNSGQMLTHFLPRRCQVPAGRILNSGLSNSARTSTRKAL